MAKVSPPLVGVSHGPSFRVGDFVNLLVLGNTFAFLVVAFLNSFGHLTSFSPSFLRDGFCLGFVETPLLSSHILCFYVDTLCALLLLFLSRTYGMKAGFAPLASSAIGVFAHGAAHLGMWAAIYHPQEPAAGSSSTPDGALKTAFRTAALCAFFFGLFRSAPNIPAAHAVVHAALHGSMLSFVVPAAFGFTYVQSAVLFVACGYDLMAPAARKDRFYDLFAVMINLPVGCVAWLEALGCDSFLKGLGGHVFYDATIPISMFAYAFVALQLQGDAGKKVR